MAFTKTQIGYLNAFDAAQQALGAATQSFDRLKLVDEFRQLEIQCRMGQPAIELEPFEDWLVSRVVERCAKIAEGSWDAYSNVLSEEYILRHRIAAAIRSSASAA